MQGNNLFCLGLKIGTPSFLFMKVQINFISRLVGTESSTYLPPN